MSLHRSLKTKPAALNQHRNVLKRDERVELLSEAGNFNMEEDSPFGLLKVANRKVVTKSVKKEKKAEEGEGEGEGEETASAE